MGVRQFEDLLAWKKARELTKAVYQVTSIGAFARDLGLRNQIQHASVSVISNITEGFERGGNNEFRQFLSQAKGSAGEVRAQLYVALDVGLIELTSFNELYDLATEVSRLIGGLIRYLENSDLKGHKLKETPGPEYQVEIYDQDCDQIT